LRTLLIITLFIFNLNASSINIEQKIYTLVLNGLFSNNDVINIWCDTKSKNKLIKNINRVKIVENKNDADILFVFNSYDIKTKKMIFVGKYRLLDQYPNNAVGGFYWQKGRPNLILIHDNVNKFNIKLIDELKEYEE